MPTRLTDRTLDLDAAQIVTDAGEVHALTPQEVALLAYLEDRAGQRVAWDELQREVWGHAAAVQSRAAYHAWRRLAPKIEPDPAHPRHIEVPRGGLRWPAPRTAVPSALVGRTALLEDLAAAVETPGVVTLWGPAGVGKTAVARALAEASARATVVDLTSVVRADELQEAVGADVLGDGVRRVVVLDPVDAHRAALRSHLAGWRQHAPNAVFVATSRTPIGVDGERVVPVEPLDADAAVALLGMRIAAAGGEPVDDATALAIVEALDRLPLAIELCAPWSRTLTAGQLLEALDRRLDLLSDGRPEGAPGATSLRAALDQSWALLTDPQRDVLAQLAVFHDPFGLEAAEAVVRHDGWLPAALRVLVDASLLLRSRDGDLSMLQGVRDRVRELSPPTDGVRDRHLAWFAAAGDGPHPDRVAAARHGLASGAIEPALACVLTAALHMRLHRGPQTAIGWVREVLLRDDLSDRWRARLLINLGGQLGSAEVYDEALEVYDRAVALARGDGDRAALASALSGRGLARAWLGQTASALGDLDAAAELTDRPARIAMNRAVVLAHGDDLDAAVAAFERAAERARIEGDDNVEGVSSLNLAVLWLDRGEPGRALPLAERAVARLTATGDGPKRANALNTLGLALQGLGRVDEAREHLRAALGVAGALKLAAHRARALSNLGELEPAERGAALQREALRVARAGGCDPEVAIALIRLARHHVDAGRTDLAAPWIQEAQALVRGPARRPDLVAELEALLARVPAPVSR